ncbi:flagellar basal-body rod protein FlgG [Anaerobacterium chartisolvens]|uniref:Flagellar basal-body rod protein FlgG n=1 Tax=Anaerobacterium chartisolvens TaxID=1297424 RepID=A0A369B0M1_9FIRM|nr:flagellar basal-body rod protein FlgG [Anaerobacterium chartisolvens]RCX13234.1 flagellar basal-body rod protein FlgG [Anaerobacterium chartisolvens]
MMRALWTAGSGMTAQQFNVDVISNNLANVNTTAYKKDRAEFKDLLYQTIDRASVLDGQGKPVNLQVGYGSTPVATVKDFSKGNFERTDNPLDLAIDGEALFAVLGPKGDVVYTRDGSFKVSVSDQGTKLTTTDGYAVLDEMESEIFLDGVEDISSINVAENGAITYINTDGETEDLGQRIGLFKFSNRQGLENLGKNLYGRTDASGEPVIDEEEGSMSVVYQRFLESSNVRVVEEMVKLIVAQRAYEVNSKAIQSADEMLGQANNLKR